MSLKHLAGAGINLSISDKNNQKIIISFIPLILDNNFSMSHNFQI